MNQLILSSEWFLAHGKMSGQTNLKFLPDKHIELICGSSNNQIIGRAIFCLDGKTKVLTENGDETLENLVNKDFRVYSMDENNEKVLSDVCTVKPTIKTDEEYQIELEDGTLIKCTANHKFLLTDGTYKEAQYLTEDDEIVEYSGEQRSN